MALIAFMLIFAVAVAIAYSYIKQEPPLRVFNPSMLNPEVVDESMRNIQQKHRIGTFSLTDQYGRSFTDANTAGKIYIADFFFTTCPSLCPKMSKQMQRVQEKIQHNSHVLILSHTVQPEYDSIPVLLEYANKQGAIKDKWFFLTGSREHIYELARKHYFTATTTGSNSLFDLIHTENFVLIDPDKRIRGFYDGTSEQEINVLINDIDVLLKEYGL